MRIFRVEFYNNQGEHTGNIVQCRWNEENKTIEGIDEATGDSASWCPFFFMMNSCPTEDASSSVEVHNHELGLIFQVQCDGNKHE